MSRLLEPLGLPWLLLPPPPLLPLGEGGAFVSFSACSCSAAAAAEFEKEEGDCAGSALGEAGTGEPAATTMGRLLVLAPRGMEEAPADAALAREGPPPTPPLPVALLAGAAFPDKASGTTTEGEIPACGEDKHHVWETTRITRR